MLVANLAVIDMGQGMRGVAGEVAGGGGGSAAGDVAAVARKNFELVEAGLGAAGLEDREADEAGRGGSEAVDVLARGDGTAQRPHSSLGQEPGDLTAAILPGRLRGKRHLALAMLDAGKDRLEPVVVGLWNGIKLVVVAAGTADGEAQER